MEAKRAEELLARVGLETRLFAEGEGAVYAVFNDRDRAKLFALGRAAGELLWRREDLEGWAMAPPVAAGEVVLLGTSRAAMTPWKEGHANWLREGSLYALDARSGETRWEDRKVGVVRESPRVQEGKLPAVLVRGEVREGGVREDGEAWEEKGYVESIFELRTGRLIDRKREGRFPPGYWD